MIWYCHAPTTCCCVLSPAIPREPTRSSSHTDGSWEVFALRIIELLNDDAVFAKLIKALYPCDVADTIDSLNAHIENLAKLEKTKDMRIAELQKKIHALEESSDNLEQ